MREKETEREIEREERDRERGRRRDICRNNKIIIISP